MFLKRIELKGFKSFADRTVIDFGEGITCIVGPNGSGKSNITDAFRWVLGEQRYKTLRGKQMNDVIFSGTNQRKALGFAEVSIAFDNTTHFLAIDFSEVIVTRRLYRSGESVYAINDAECRLKDIKQLFMDTGVGVEGYSIIGQGRIDSILSTNKDERRLIIEEAAGIVKYRTRKDEAERKLGRVNENLTRINDIVAELAERVEPLKAQAAKASQYKALAAELRALEVNIFVHDIEAADQKIKLLNEEIADRRRALSDDENALNSQLAELAACDRDIAQDEANYQAALSTIGQLKGDIARLAGEVAVLQERLTGLKDNRGSTDQQLEVNRTALLENNEQLRAAAAELEAARGGADKWQQTLREVSAEFDSLTSERDRYELERRQRQVAIDGMTAAINNLQQDNDRLTARDEIAEQRLDAIDQDIDSFQLTLRQEGARAAEYRAEAERLATDLSAANEARSALVARTELAKRAINQAEGELYRLRSQLAEDETTLAALQLQESQHEGFSHATKQVLKWSQSDDGVYGSVKDLFTIDKKFFIAIETALGRHLQSIVVRDEDVVDDYIERLKLEKAGRATFIPVAQVQPRELPKPDSGPGYYGCAWYLIDCRAELAPALQYLLSGIFFSDTLSDAKRIAKRLPKGARVISLAGEVVHVGGTITGGSIAKRDGGFLARKNDIENLLTKIDENRKKRDRQEQLRRDQLDELTAQDNQIQQLDGEIAARQEQLNRLQQQCITAEQQVAQIGKQRDQMNDEATALRTAKQTRAQQQADNEAALAAQGTALGAARTQLDEVTTLLQRQVEQLGDCESRLTDCKIELAKARQVVESTNLKQTHLTEQETTLTRRGERLTSDLRALNDAIELTDNAIAETVDKHLTAQQKLAEFDEKTAADKLIVEQKRRRQSELQGLIERDRLALQDKKNDVFKVELDLTRIETRRDAIIQNLWDTYELSYIKALDYKQDVDIKAYASRARSLKRQIKQLGDVNLGAIAEYDTVSERYQFLSEQQQDLLQSNEKLGKMIKEIDRQMRKTFKDKLHEVNLYFKDIFS